MLSLEVRELGYQIDGPIEPAAIRVQRTNSRVRMVRGHATLPGPAGGVATVDFDLLSLPAGYHAAEAGSIQIRDPQAGIDVTVEVDYSEARGRRVVDVTYVEDNERPCIERAIVGVSPASGVNAARGTHRAVDTSGRPVTVIWQVDDAGTLPDTAHLRDLRVVSAPGLGSDGNVMAWAMASFRGDLYVATCNWRLDGFGDWEKWAFSRGPIDTSSGAQIWRYRPRDGIEADWACVVDVGLGDPYNHGIRNMTVADDHLYAITANHTNGFEVWRTGDGNDWLPVMTDGFGTTENTSGRGIAVFGDHLYVGTENKDTGAEIWRAAIDRAGDRDAWQRVLGDDVTRSWYAELTPFDGHLYAGSLMTHTSAEDAGAEQHHPGCRVVRSDDGTSWTDVVPDSFGNPENLGILSMAVLAGELYVATTNGQGAEVYRSGDGCTWELTYKAAGDPQREWHGWKLHVHDGRLYLGLGRLEDVWWSGFRLVSTADGTEWVDEIEPSLVTHYGLRSMASHDGHLYLGTASFPDCAVVIEARQQDR
jgi:hypothetical protein